MRAFRLAALVLALVCPVGAAYGVLATDRGIIPNDGKDDTNALQRAIRDGYDVIEFPYGDYNFKKAILNGYLQAWQKFRLVGAAPVTTWQHEADGWDRTYTRFIIEGLKDDEFWFNYVSPAGVRSGSQQFENIHFERVTPGPILRFAGAATPTDVTVAARGTLIRYCGFAMRNAGAWPHYYRGGELPTLPAGPCIELQDQYDTNIDHCQAWGIDFVYASMCDRLRIRDCHWGHSARGIVIIDGIVPATITGGHCERVIISGIDAAISNIDDNSVEVGYFTEVGPSTLPDNAHWTTEPGTDWSGRVRVTGVDARRWVPRWSNVMLGDYLVYVTDVDKDGFSTAANWVGCKLGRWEGTGASLTRLMGVPYTVRGDYCTLDHWTANINKPVHGLPVACLYPMGRALNVGANQNGVDSTSNDTNRAMVGLWSWATAPPYWRGGHVWWLANENYRPRHPRVFPAPGPHIDPHLGLVEAIP